MTVAPLDQPDDWTEPGAHPVVAGIHRVPLPLPFDGLHAVNVYVIEDPDGLVVVDSGWAGPDTEKALDCALRELGYGLNDIDQFVITHAHWDHYTQALALRESHGARVRIGRGERPSIEEFDIDILDPEQVRLLRRCGAPELALRVGARQLEDHELDVPFGLPDDWLDDGQQITLGQRSLEVLATPGHTRGHIVLRDASAGVLFSGDHVLPHITPSLAFERSPEPRPLRSFLDSLRVVQDLPDTVFLPAHGPVGHSAHTRVEELLAHHEERLETVLAEVRSGARTAYEVARALPWTRRGRKLDELDLMHQMTAVLEIDAHLDLLADQGQLTHAMSGGARLFEVAP